jgi:hypothetical protein
MRAKIVPSQKRSVLLLSLLIVSAGCLVAQDSKKKNSSPPPAHPAAQPAAAPARAPGNSGGGAVNRGPSPAAPGGGAHPSGPSGLHPSGPSPLHPGGPSPAHPGGPTSPGPGPQGGHPVDQLGGGGRGSAGGPGPRPAGQPIHLGGGRTAPAGINGRPAPANSHQINVPGRGAVQVRGNGHVSDVHDSKRGMDIHHNLNGGHRVEVERSDHTRIVAERGRPGFVQRPYSFHGHDFARRTYYYHGRMYDRYYRSYQYRGVWVNVYAPVRYYPSGFYGWAYNPWYRPVVYTWGWGPAPWYGYYGGYFAPYPSYPEASYWLTDYMVANALQAEYQANQEAQIAAQPVPQGDAPVLTPEVKKMISDEVRSQLALESSEAQQNAQNQDPDPASSGIARLLSDGRSHVFVAAGPMDLVDSSGNECALTPGDVLGLNAAPDPNAEAADMVVLSSKGNQECQKSAVVTVQLSDLQDMQNHMRETIDQGLEELQTKAGKNGLPTAPPSAQPQPTTVAFAQVAPPPDPAGADEVNNQLKEADAAEHEVTSQAQEGSGIAVPPPAKSTVTITLGQSIDEVKAALGQPVSVADLGSKKIYRYSDMKITFKDGKVADVQ